MALSEFPPQPDDIGLDDYAAKLAAEKSGHSVYCSWHNVMAYLENWTTSQIEDPTAEWCKGEPTVDLLVEWAVSSDTCRCD